MDLAAAASYDEKPTSSQVLPPYPYMPTTLQASRDKLKLYSPSNSPPSSPPSIGISGIDDSSKCFVDGLNIIIGRVCEYGLRGGR